ncbi:hypothetical protein ZWY2020_040735 [Hordeum vulgare]|nr:hypothetical protein ZWY2020_040735 [Hordeum vulgare]
MVLFNIGSGEDDWVELLFLPARLDQWLAMARAERGPVVRRRLLPGTAAATPCYGLYRLYLHHRRCITATLSLTDALSHVGSDLAGFLCSDSDHVPHSLL